jgi:hypothetical protein
VLHGVRLDLHVHLVAAVGEFEDAFDGPRARSVVRGVGRAARGRAGGEAQEDDAVVIRAALIEQRPGLLGEQAHLDAGAREPLRVAHDGEHDRHPAPVHVPRGVLLQVRHLPQQRR